MSLNSNRLRFAPRAQSLEPAFSLEEGERSRGDNGNSPAPRASSFVRGVEGPTVKLRRK